MDVRDARGEYRVDLAPAAGADEIPRGYKRTEIGAIPEGWLVSTFGAETDFLTGFPFASGGFATSGVRLLRGSNVKRGATDWSDDITEYWPSSPTKLERYVLRKDDVVIAMDGALVGRSFAVLSSEDLPALLVQRVARLREKGADVRLIAAWCGSESFVRHVDSVKTHTAIPHISPKDIKSFPFVLPAERAEQRAIAEALSDADALLGALDRLIAKKRNLKQAAMQQLLTGQTRLPGFTEAWEVKRLGDHATFLKHGVNSRAELTTDGVVKYLHYGDIHGADGLLLDPNVVPMPHLPKSKACGLDRLLDGDVVFADASEDVDGVGKSVELCGVGQTEVVSGMHTIAVRFDKQILADGFKAYLQFIPAFRQHLRRLAAGTKVYATNRGQIANAEVSFPSRTEQREIAAVLSDMDAEIKALEARRAKSRDLKEAMMQELLTGRTRLV